MKKEINLIDAEVQKTISLLRLKKGARFFCVLVSSFFLFLTAAVLVFLVYFQRKIDVNKKNISLLNSQINSLNKIESYAVTIADRVKGINTIFKNKKNYYQILDDLANLIVNDFSLDRVDFGEDYIKIDGTCRNRQCLEAFNSQLEKLALGGRYSQIIYPSVGRDSAGQFFIIVELKK